MLPKGQERVGDRKRLDIEGEAEGRGGRRTRAESSAESILSFGYCPTFLLSLFVRNNRHGYRRSQQGEGGLVMPHGGRTAVKITGFYSTARCCNQGRAVTPRCLSGFDGTPKNI